MNQEKLTALEEAINRDYSNTAGIVVLKNGRTVYENYFNNCTSASPIHVFSVTKSIISILTGIAIDKGYIRSVDQKVLEFFPDYKVEKGEKTIQNITIQNLLTMTAPFKYKEEPYIEYFTSDDWVKFALDLLGGQEQTGEFRYTPIIGPDILSGILAVAAGRSVLDFAAEYLFGPLGITVESNVIFHSQEEQMAFMQAVDISGWVAGPTGVNTAGWGLTLTASDMAKIGQLCLNGGKWNGKQIVSAQWVAQSTREHSRWEIMNLPYGYLWWIVDGDGFAAMGDGGNVIYVNTRKQMVISIACLFEPDAADRIDFINAYVEPAFEDEV